MEKKNPKYKEIAKDLQTKIENGVYKSGERLPVERILCETYNVSRMTIRHALQYLEKKNIIRIDPSRGPFVLDTRIERRQEIHSFSELMEQKGYTCHSKVIQLEKVMPDILLQERFQISEKDPVYLLHRVRYANDEVMALEYAYINAKFCPGLEMFNFEKYSLYDIFHEHYNIQIAYAKDEICADSIHGEDAMTLIGKKSGPALIVVDTGYDKEHNPIEYTKTIYNYKSFTYTVILDKKSKRYKN